MTDATLEMKSQLSQRRWIPATVRLIIWRLRDDDQTADAEEPHRTLCRDRRRPEGPGGNQGESSFKVWFPRELLGSPRQYLTIGGRTLPEKDF